jgi:hypothetical protein
LVTLVLLTPVPWRRRWRALAWGLVLVGGFVLLRMWLIIFNAFCSPTALALFDPSPFWRRTLAFTTEMLTKSLTTSFVVPLAIWVLVCFRRGDLAALKGRPAMQARPALRSDEPSKRRKRRRRH